MVGVSDPFRCYFEKLDGGLLKCIFCGNTLAGSTSTTRMKCHLARVGGGGVKVCEKVTPDVQRAAFDKLPDRMRGSMPSSSNNIIVTADSDPAQDLEKQQQGQSEMDMNNITSSLTRNVELSSVELDLGRDCACCGDHGS